MIAEGKQARNKLFAYTEDEVTKRIYQILENMLQQNESTNINLSIWSNKQVTSFSNELNEKNIKLDTIQNRIKIKEAITTYACMLASYTTQMVRQRLQINKNEKKRYGPPTRKQSLHEQRHSDTWTDYEKRIHQVQKKRKKSKISQKQLLINNKKFHLINNQIKLKAHENKYEHPILTCAVRKLDNWSNDIPYLKKRKNIGAKIENQYQRYLSWRRFHFPRKPTLPTSTVPSEIDLRNIKKRREIRCQRKRKLLLQKPHFLQLFCEHHGLDYNDLSINNATLPPPILDHG